MPARLYNVHIPSSAHLKKVFVFCLALVVFDTAWAQDLVTGVAQTKHLGPVLDVGIASCREDLIVPLGFHGPAFSLGTIFTRKTEKYLARVRFRIGMGHMENRYSHEAWVLFSDCRFSWVAKLSAHDRYGEFWGGFCVPLQMNNLFIESWDDAHLYWLTSYTTGPAFLWMKTISARNYVHVRVETPLFGWVSRPPTYRYSKQDPLNHWTYHFSETNRALHFETLDTYRDLCLEIDFNRKMGRSLFNVGYELEYNYCKQPANIWAITSTVFVSYRWGIGR